MIRQTDRQTDRVRVVRERERERERQTLMIILTITGLSVWAVLIEIAAPPLPPPLGCLESIAALAKLSSYIHVSVPLAASKFPTRVKFA